MSSQALGLAVEFHEIHETPEHALVGVEWRRRIGRGRIAGRAGSALAARWRRWRRARGVLAAALLAPARSPRHPAAELRP